MFSFFRRPKQLVQREPVQRDLEQLIYDIAEKQSNEDFLTLYRLMQSRLVFVPILRESLPAGVAPGAKYVTGESDQLKMRSVATPAGEVAAICTTREDAAILKDGYVGMEWTAFLAMTLKLDESIRSALLQGKSSWIAFDRSRIKFFLGGEWDVGSPPVPRELPAATPSQPRHSESGQALETVVVPPGHKVVVISPSPVAHVASVASGAWIVDYGSNGDWRNTNFRFDEAFSIRPGPTVVILQNEMIEAIIRSHALGEFFAYWKRSRDKDVSAVWVLPLAASTQSSVVASIRKTGYGVHTSAPDGACFVEVHKSDGTITMGMPGPVL